MMAEARERISLDALGIAGQRVKPAFNGGLLIQISGKDRIQKADDLADRLRAIWEEDPKIRVARPTKYAELRV